MAWSYKIGALFRKNGQTSVEVAFANDADPTTNFSMMYFPDTLDALKNTIQSQLDLCNRGDSLYSGITPGTSLPNLTVTPQTQAQLDIQKFQQDYFYLQQAQKAIAAGLIQSTDTTYQALLTRVQNEFATVVANVGKAQALTYLNVP